MAMSSFAVAVALLPANPNAHLFSPNSSANRRLSILTPLLLILRASVLFAASLPALIPLLC